jgi:hypothetical protein
MSLEHSPARSRAAYTINEFCDAHRISRGKLYQLWATGLSPRFMNVGKKRLITDEAAADWRGEGERRAAGKDA